MELKAVLSRFRQMVGLSLIVAVFSFTTVVAQGTTNGVTITPEPLTPFTFTSFPLSLLGIGGSDANLSSFNNFGLRFENNSGSVKIIRMGIDLKTSQGSIFNKKYLVTLTIPSGVPIFVGVPQILNGSFGSIKASNRQSISISDDFMKQIKGGFPSGLFTFDIKAGLPNVNNYDGLDYMGSLQIQVLGNSPVEIISPSFGFESIDGLPQFAWSAQGATKFLLTIARKKGSQSDEGAIKSVVQRAVIELDNVFSYSLPSGGPSTSKENNLNCNPGLEPGDYVFQVTAVIQDNFTGKSRNVDSPIRAFTVKETISSTAGLNTEEILGLLNDAAKGAVNFKDQLKGFKAVSISIKGNTATIDDLRTAVQNLPEAVKFEIKP
ncbi:MAG TPA: hypothetical protein PLG25_07180 [bacterium]|nr:hypothetical protein [bacterium]HMY34841.1 hypothetical protein [bacterium]HMZ03384.1 hypothetical protein [bacterium]HNB07978.1 hypothetical protein [bacterium]HNB55401.1 hypothetical protein [bacterium]